MSDMTGFNNQSTHGSYAYSIPFNSVDEDTSYASMEPPISMDSNDIYSGHPSQASNPGSPSSQPRWQAFPQPPSYTNFIPNLSWSYEDRVTHDGLTNDNPPAIHYSVPHSLVQTSTSFLSNNSGMMTNATSHGCVVIVTKADINVERLLSIIQLFGRVERLYGCSSFFIYRIFWY